MSTVIEPENRATATASAPDSWGAGGQPDPVSRQRDGLIGAPISRLDGPLKVRGAARFAAEVPMADMLFAALAYSIIPKGRLATLDTSAAEGGSGVVLVMTHLNSPPMKPGPIFFSSEKAVALDDLPIMQDDRVHWNGQPIALVLAESQEEADHAASLIQPTYIAGPAITAFGKPRAQSRQGSFGPEELANEIGDAEAALAAAPYRVDSTYRTPFLNHNAIELHALTLAWDGDDLVVHDCTQGVKHTAFCLATVFGIREEQVHVTSPFVGGAFGGKTFWQHQVLAAAAAKLAERPVRMVLSREGVYRVAGGRTMTEQRVAIGATSNGHFEALIHTGTSAITPRSSMPEPFIWPAQCLYAAASIKLNVQVTELNMLANTAMRAPGEAVGSFALECAIDELADRIGIDPIELRIYNEPAANPITGRQFSSRNLIEAYRTGAERFGWNARNARPGSRHDGEWLIGVGCASATYPYARMPGGAARITLRKDGNATVQVAAHEMGMGTATVHTQIAAARLGLPLENVRVDYGASSMPGLVIAGGSQQTASIGAAVIAAQRVLVSELLNLVHEDSPLFGLEREDVVAKNSGLCKADDPRRCESYCSILARVRRDELSVEADAPPPLEAQQWSMHSYGAQFCEVRVNSVTGETRVSRFLGSFDCGRILNARTAKSQFRGGIIMGLGLALLEETQIDQRNGRIMNPSLSEYHVPVHMDVPEIDVIWTDIPDPHAPMGAHGIGEIGITGAAAAVANAIYNATGQRFRELPITLDKLLARWA